MQEVLKKNLLVELSPFMFFFEQCSLVLVGSGLDDDEDGL